MNTADDLAITDREIVSERERERRGETGRQRKQGQANSITAQEVYIFRHWHGHVRIINFLLVRFSATLRCQSVALFHLSISIPICPSFCS